MNRITVFCGSSFGHDEDFKAQAEALGEKLALEKIDLIYGGANVGLMGAVADGALKHSGKVIGVLPQFLKSKEIAHNGYVEFLSCSEICFLHNFIIFV